MSPRIESLDLYLADMGKRTKGKLYHSREEEAALAARIQAGDEEALEELIERNLPFVVRTAKQFQGRGLDLEDLVAAGNAGILVAARKFRSHKDVRFISYAVWWIRQKIMKSLTDHGGIIRMPQNQVMRGIAISRVQAEHRESFGRNLTPEELAEMFKLPVSDIELHLVGRQGDSLDRPNRLGERSVHGDRGDLYHRIAGPAVAPDTFVAFEEVNHQETLHKKIMEVIDALPFGDRDKRVFLLCFGLEDGEFHTLEDIGQTMGFTRERARQIRDRVMEKLRRHLQREPELTEFFRSCLV